MGWTPYVCLRETGTDKAIAFHLLPNGNWIIRATINGFQQGLQMVVLELGLADEGLHLVVQPGESIALPDILTQPLPGGEPHLNAHILHEYTHQRVDPAARNQPPIVYNTWFDRFDHLELPLLHQQLGAARRLGCEVFVVDAGWFGPEADDWSQAVGDWREKTSTAFYGERAAFTDEVRRLGLGFGLWMEPERFHRSVPVCRQHPEWFIPVPATEDSRIDLE